LAGGNGDGSCEIIGCSSSEVADEKVGGKSNDVDCEKGDDKSTEEAVNCC
jgi:uncharacterized protein YwlG (UPF0340 family)